MNPVQPEELSALIDGELDPTRAAEVQSQIEANSELRTVFRALSAQDDSWRTAARTATFVPQVHLSRGGRSNGWLLQLATTAALVGVRIAVRTTDTTVIAFAFQALVLVAVFAGVAWLRPIEQRTHNLAAT